MTSAPRPPRAGNRSAAAARRVSERRTAAHRSADRGSPAVPRIRLRGMEPGPSRAALVRRARRINRELARLYPDARIELNFTSPIELLVAAILSARTPARRAHPGPPGLVAPER